MASPTSLRIRYPAFAQVDDAVIAFWLTDAARYVGDWGADTDPALEAYAAHKMASTPGVLAAEAGTVDAAVATVQASGVTSFRSGSFSIQMSDAAAAAQVKGGYDSTPYGKEFKLLLRRHTGGPRLVGWAGCAAHESGWVL